jgi:hypothetical protein
MAGTGGKRPGSGRPKAAISILRRDLSAEILAQANPRAIWDKLLKSADEKIVLDAVKYLSNRVYGMPTQAVTLGNPDGSPLTVTVRHIGGDEQ